MKAKRLFLVDSGLMMNSPYPLLLRPQREVDIYLSFDFSAREREDMTPFQVRPIVMTRQHCSRQHIHWILKSDHSTRRPFISAPKFLYDSLLRMRTGRAQNLGSRITTKARIQHEIARKIQRIAPDVHDSL